MTAREREAALLTRCVVVAREAIPMVLDQCEANVFRVAAIVFRSRFPRESMSLMLASEQYFALNPNEGVDPADVVRNGWISGRHACVTGDVVNLMCADIEPGGVAAV